MPPRKKGTRAPKTPHANRAYYNAHAGRNKAHDKPPPLTSPYSRGVVVDDEGELAGLHGVEVLREGLPHQLQAGRGGRDRHRTSAASEHARRGLAQGLRGGGGMKGRMDGRMD